MSCATLAIQASAANDEWMKNLCGFRSVQWYLQKGSSELVHNVVMTGVDLALDAEVRAQPADDGGARFLGAFTQGPPKGRFVHLCSGTCAGQFGSCWTRRVKVPLLGISWPLAFDASSMPNTKLVAEFDGTARGNAGSRNGYEGRTRDVGWCSPNRTASG